MFIITSVYFFILFLIFWSYSGYIILLMVFNTLNPRPKNRESANTPIGKMAIIVPCYNEEDYVKEKVDNLKDLKYEGDFDVYFLDGLSTDNTREEIARLIEGLPNWHLVETACSGKINQINYGLSKIGNDVDIIVNTDMDAILSPDVLARFASEFSADSRVAVVGANIAPRNCIPIEEAYWCDQNLIRILESNVYTSSIVVAPCYAYKAWLVDKFPEDCVADDIYVAFKANTEGFLTKYIEEATGYETRSPNSFEEFLRHKYRKGNAYLVELFRYLYRLPYMSGWWKVIYLTKVLQLAIMPWVIFYFLLATISLSLSGWGMAKIGVFGIVFLFGSLVLTSLMLVEIKSRSSQLGGGEKRRRRFIVLPFIMSNIILILVGLSYPFYRQTSNYEKLD